MICFTCCGTFVQGIDSGNYFTFPTLLACYWTLATNMKGACKTNFWPKLGFCPNGSDPIPTFETKTTTIQNGDFVGILSQYGRGSPVPTKKSLKITSKSPIIKKWDFSMKKLYAWNSLKCIPWENNTEQGLAFKLLQETIHMTWDSAEPSGSVDAIKA